MDNKIEYTNEADGLKAFVTSGARGFHVSLQDLDSCEFVAQVLIYPTLDEAIRSARKAAGLEG